jgi:hypothetical protein
MGFFNKLKNQLRKSIRTGEAPVMPSRGRFLERMPQTKPGITDMRFRGRMPQKFTGLNGLFRRSFLTGLKIPNRRTPLEDMITSGRLPQPSMDEDRLRIMDEDRIMRGPGMPGGRRSFLTGLRIPNRRTPLEDMIAGGRLPKAVGLNPDYVPPASTMPELPDFQSPVVPTPAPGPIFKKKLKEFGTARILDDSALERAIAEMGAVRKEVPMQTPVMNQMQGEPRMMMAGGRDANMVDFLNSDPQQQIFGIETRIGILENQLEEAKANNDRQAYDMIVQQINDADAQRIELMNLSGNLDRSRDQLIASASNRASDPDLFVEEFYGRMDPLLEKEGKSYENLRLNMRKKRLLDMMRNSSRFRGGKDNARSPSRRDLELMEMQRSQRDSLDDILSDLEKKN